MTPNSSHKLMGTKRGMVQVYDKDGNPIVCTLLHVEPSVVTQKKTQENDGYEAVQLAYKEVSVRDPRTMAKRVNKPQLGHFKKANVQPRRFIYEVRVENSESFEVGQKMSLQLFEGVSHIDVTGKSKGKGYQGVMKKYGFAGMPKSHGAGPTHRHAGSTGMRSSPGRCLPGGPRPSHMGDAQVTVQNLRVVSIDLTSNIMLVEGAVPGAKNGVVVLSNAVKKPRV